jgi:hypothetical protein
MICEERKQGIKSTIHLVLLSFTFVYSEGRKVADVKVESTATTLLPYCRKRVSSILGSSRVWEHHCCSVCYSASASKRDHFFLAALLAFVLVKAETMHDGRSGGKIRMTEKFWLRANLRTERF